MSDNDWTRENGKAVLWWAENASGHVFLTSPMSPLPPGFMRKRTKNPKDMDCVFNRLHEQEREHNEKLIEGIYKRGRENVDRMRSEMRTRLASGSVSDAEKNIIRAGLKLMDEKDAKMQQNTVYGVSAMQEAPEPLPARNTKVTIN